MKALVKKISVIAFTSVLLGQSGSAMGGEQGSFRLTKTLRYRFQWDLGQCSYAQLEVEREAADTCRRSGLKPKLLKIEAQSCVLENRNYTDHYSAYFTCGDT